jgi:predicted  nucleic acid-binding Zn-ribbon protein
MSITPDTTPHADDYEAPPPASTPLWIPILIVLLFIGLGAVSYAGYTSRTRLERLENDLSTSNAHADLLSKELEQTNGRVAALRGQLDVTSQKLGLTQDELARARTLAQTIQKQQQASDAQLGEQIGQVKQESEQKIGEVSTDLTGAKTDIASTKKDLDDTKSKLTSTIGDLGVQSGLIARNREEVEALKRLNERNIFDFNLTKSKNPQRVGPIQITLRSTDPKRFRFTMTVIADDKAIEKKDRNVDEPMQFYVRGTHTPYEIVVFEVTKDRATGYLSTSKDTGAAPAAAAPSAAASPTNAPTASPARQ